MYCRYCSAKSMAGRVLYLLLDTVGYEGPSGGATGFPSLPCHALLSLAVATGTLRSRHSP